MLLRIHRSWCMHVPASFPLGAVVPRWHQSLWLPAPPATSSVPRGRVQHTSTNCPLGNLAVPHDLLTRGPFQINQISPSPLRPASYLTPLSSKLWGCGGWELLSEGPSNPRGQRVRGSGLDGGKAGSVCCVPVTDPLESRF